MRTKHKSVLNGTIDYNFGAKVDLDVKHIEGSLMYELSFKATLPDKEYTYTGRFSNSDDLFKIISFSDIKDIPCDEPMCINNNSAYGNLFNYYNKRDMNNDIFINYSNCEFGWKDETLRIHNNRNGYDISYDKTIYFKKRSGISRYTANLNFIIVGDKISLQSIYFKEFNPKTNEFLYIRANTLNRLLNIYNETFRDNSPINTNKNCISVLDDNISYNIEFSNRGSKYITNISAINLDTKDSIKIDYRDNNDIRCCIVNKENIDDNNSRIRYVYSFDKDSNKDQKVSIYINNEYNKTLSLFLNNGHKFDDKAFMSNSYRFSLSNGIDINTHIDYTEISMIGAAIQKQSLKYSYTNEDSYRLFKEISLEELDDKHFMLITTGNSSKPSEDDHNYEYSETTEKIELKDGIKLISNSLIYDINSHFEEIVPQDMVDFVSSRKINILGKETAIPLSNDLEGFTDLIKSLEVFTKETLMDICTSIRTKVDGLV